MVQIKRTSNNTQPSKGTSSFQTIVKLVLCGASFYNGILFEGLQSDPHSWKDNEGTDTSFDNSNPRIQAIVNQRLQAGKLKCNHIFGI